MTTIKEVNDEFEEAADKFFQFWDQLISPTKVNDIKMGKKYRLIRSDLE